MSDRTRWQPAHRTRVRSTRLPPIQTETSGDMTACCCTLKGTARSAPVVARNFCCLKSSVRQGRTGCPTASRWWGIFASKDRCPRAHTLSIRSSLVPVSDFRQPPGALGLLQNSKSSALTGVRVRISPRAPSKSGHHFAVIVAAPRAAVCGASGAHPGPVARRFGPAPRGRGNNACKCSRLAPRWDMAEPMGRAQPGPTATGGRGLCVTGCGAR